ncbi:hypothetical protein [Vibrio atlanticus]|uniref:hypothetical protein n=1 Tax=Vibrio atlanticus TaxID=693153 RepID=UPI0022AF6FFB|nr:hypothetical protein [Vibrio atlanticus]MCZ4311640.1 hypothetical protein [Vibrio atlanticus]
MNNLGNLYTALIKKADEDELYDICKDLRLEGVKAEQISSFLRVYINQSLDKKDLYKLDILGVMQDLHGMCVEKYSLAEKSPALEHKAVAH